MLPRANTLCAPPVLLAGAVPRQPPSPALGPALLNRPKRSRVARCLAHKSIGQVLGTLALLRRCAQVEPEDAGAERRAACWPLTYDPPIS